MSIFGNKFNYLNYGMSKIININFLQITSSKGWGGGGVGFKIKNFEELLIKTGAPKKGIGANPSLHPRTSRPLVSARVVRLS